MADNGNGNNGAAQPEAPQVRMQVLGQYVRDLSFENVVMRKPIQGEVSPETQVQVGLDGRKRSQDDQYEVITKFKVTSKNRNSEDVLFLLEVEYVGVFHISGVPEDQLHPYLLIQCPTILFPYVRRIVSDVTRDGGFPPLNLELIDFVALYRQEVQRRAEAQKAATN